MPRRKGPKLPRKLVGPRPGSRANPLRVVHAPRCQVARANCGHIWERKPVPRSTVLYAVSHLVDGVITAAFLQNVADGGPRCDANHPLTMEAKAISIGEQCRRGELSVTSPASEENL